MEKTLVDLVQMVNGEYNFFLSTTVLPLNP